MLRPFVDRQCAMRLLGASALIAMLLLGGCGEPKEEMVGGSVVVLNYSEVDFSPSVRSLDAQGNAISSAGYPVGPRAGGGKAACCVSIPAKWRPGIKIAVRYHLGDWPDDRYEMFYTELPRYPDDIAGDVWVSLFPDRTIEVVASMYGPETKTGKWPGRVARDPH